VPTPVWNQSDVEVELDVRMQVGESAQVNGLAVDWGPKALVKSPPTRGARYFPCPNLPLKRWVGVDADDM
jgi:hypothetical protein